MTDSTVINQEKKLFLNPAIHVQSNYFERNRKYFFHFQVNIPWTSPAYANNLTITIQPPVSTQFLKISPRGPLSGNGSCLKIDVLDSMACKSLGQNMSGMIMASCTVMVVVVVMDVVMDVVVGKQQKCGGGGGGEGNTIKYFWPWWFL